MASVTCELPWPPSANHAWRPTNAGGKILAEPYRVFIKTVGDYVLEQRVRRHWTKDRLAAGLVFYPPNPRFFDIDNRVKTVLDALVRSGVIVDDRYIDMIVLLRGEVHEPHGAVLVHIEELSTLPPQFLALLPWLNPAAKSAAVYDGARKPLNPGDFDGHHHAEKGRS